jgi:nitroreductase
MSKECIEKIKTRQSIRKFTADTIPESTIEDIIKIGISSPSAGNCQPWRIVVVRKDELKQQLANAAFNQKFIAKAPVIFVICAVPEESAERYQERGRSLYAIQDTAALTLNLLLGAHLHGYGACWIGAFSEEAVSQVLNIPPFMRPVSMVPVGSVGGNLPPMRSRKDVSDIVVRDKFE